MDRWALRLQLIDDPDQDSSIRLGFLYACAEFVRLTSPSDNIRFFLLNSTLLDLYVMADSAIIVLVGREAVVRQLCSASLSGAPLSLALSFHVAPFPVIAFIINAREIAHHGCSKVSLFSN